MRSISVMMAIRATRCGGAALGTWGYDRQRPLAAIALGRVVGSAAVF
jgi:hypothetical protein